MNIPAFATHYFLPEKGPFRSLSDIPLGDEDPVFRELLIRHTVDAQYRRRFGADYLRKRRAIESELRGLFINRGGVPIRHAPYYLTLGESRWFKGLNDQHKELRIELVKLNPKTTSVTFPDSFVSMTRQDKPYYRKVYFLHELPHVVETYGFPRDDAEVTYEEYWRTDFEVYVELQIWEEIDHESIRQLGSEA